MKPAQTRASIFLRNCLRSKLLLTVAFVWACPAQAQLFIDLPDLTLQPNQSGQSFDIYLRNEGSDLDVNGLEFDIEVASGGPAISEADILSGTAFSSNNTGTRGATQTSPQALQRITSTGGGTVVIPSGSSQIPDRKVATVTFSTAGVSSGVYNYTLDTVEYGPTYYTVDDPVDFQVFPTLSPGTLTVVPEPATSALLSGLVCLGLGVVYRLRKGQAPHQ